jgi:hypothetical protein
MLAAVAMARSLGPRRLIGFAAVAGLSAAVLNAGHVSRTAPLIGRDGASAEAGPATDDDRLPPVWALYVNTTADPRALASNALRNAALHAVTPSRGLNAWLEDRIIAAHRAMRFDPSDDRTTYGPAFRVGPFRLHEDFVGNPLHLLAGLVAAFAVWFRRGAFGERARLWTWMCAASAIVFCATIKWQPWNSRLHLPLFVLVSPLIGVGLERPRRLAAACAVAFCLLAVPSLVATWPRHLVGPDSVVTMPRTAQRFRNHPQLRPVYEAAAGVVERMECKQVGLILGGDGWEYPLWPLLRARLGEDLRMEHVLVQNASARFGAPAPPAPCVVLAVGRDAEGAIRWQGRVFVKRWQWTPVRVYRPEPSPAGPLTHRSGGPDPTAPAGPGARPGRPRALNNTTAAGRSALSSRPGERRAIQGRACESTAMPRAGPVVAPIDGSLA